jgi:hypothetical protein
LGVAMPDGVDYESYETTVRKALAARRKELRSKIRAARKTMKDAKTKPSMRKAREEMNKLQKELQKIEKGAREAMQLAASGWTSDDGEAKRALGSRGASGVLSDKEMAEDDRKKAFYERGSGLADRYLGTDSIADDVLDQAGFGDKVAAPGPDRTARINEIREQKRVASQKALNEAKAALKEAEEGGDEEVIKAAKKAKQEAQDIVDNPTSLRRIGEMVDAEGGDPQASARRSYWTSYAMELLEILEVRVLPRQLRARASPPSIRRLSVQQCGVEPMTR